MVVNDNAGKIFDSLMYISIYFNYKEWDDSWKRRGFKNPEQYFNYYNTIKESIDILPAYIWPLFYNDNNNASIVIDYYYTTFESDITFNKFIKNIRSKKFKEYLYTNLLKSDINEINNKLLYDNIKNLQMNENVLYEIQYLIYNYNSVINETIDILGKIHKEVSKMHEDNKTIIDNFYKDITQEKAINQINEIYNCEISYFKVSFSLLNQYVIISNIDQLFFTFGLKYMEQLENIAFSNYISYEKFLYLCSEENRLDILKMLHKHEKLTMNEISELIYKSYNTTVRHVNELYYHFVIRKVEKDGKKNYYSINKDFFRKVKKSLDDMIDMFSN